MRIFVLIFSLISLASGYEVASQKLLSKDSSKETSFVGRWQVKFKMVDGDEKNVVLVAQENGMGSFELLDTGPDNKPVLTPQPATWSKTLDKISVSSNLELPIGTCCRETGTLILKAKFASGSSFSGKLIFVTNIDEDESPYKYHSTVGTFSATRLPAN